jgi:hypothetical protein
MDQFAAGLARTACFAVPLTVILHLAENAKLVLLRIAIIALTALIVRHSTHHCLCGL